MPEGIDFNLLISFAGFVVIVGGAAIWLRSALVKQRHQELEELADTRGKRIEDLETIVREQGKEVAELRGELKLMRELLVSDIAEKTATQVVQAIQEHLQ